MVSSSSTTSLLFTAATSTTESTIFSISLQFEARHRCPVKETTPSSTETEKLFMSMERITSYFHNRSQISIRMLLSERTISFGLDFRITILPQLWFSIHEYHVVGCPFAIIHSIPGRALIVMKPKCYKSANFLQTSLSAAFGSLS